VEPPPTKFAATSGICEVAPTEVTLVNEHQCQVKTDRERNISLRTRGWKLRRKVSNITAGEARLGFGIRVPISHAAVARREQETDTACTCSVTQMSQTNRRRRMERIYRVVQSCCMCDGHSLRERSARRLRSSWRSSEADWGARARSQATGNEEKN
jgi:hypothetical protein